MMHCLVHESLNSDLIGWRRHLHAHPELSLQEHATALFVCERLREIGVPFTAGVGGTGVVATLTRGHLTRSVGLRADMDALPITEKEGLPYASKVPGVMHACGHDGHTASLLGAAALLAAADDWSGAVQFVFQPAEEGLGGAKAMLADGLFERFPMERIFGYHNWPGVDAGAVVVHDGAVMAAGARISITLRGHAGHAAMPHLARDPVLAAAHLLVGLQSIIARNVDPLDTAVLSICTIDGGVAVNQIPSVAVMRGTFRTHREPVAELIEAGIRRIAAGAALTFDVSSEVEIVRGVPATVNTPAEAALAGSAARDAGLPLCTTMPPSMAGEDFGWYLRERPGAFVWIGNGPAALGRELHNPGYDFNDSVLAPAASWFVAVAKRALAG